MCLVDHRMRSQLQLRNDKHNESILFLKHCLPQNRIDLEANLMPSRLLVNLHVGVFRIF